MNEGEDYIGRDEVIDKIAYLVNSLGNGEHFCLALDGEWGSGKTFIMNRLNEKFSKNEENLVVYYDAWKNNFYHDPLIAILYCILDGLKDYVNKNHSIGKAVKEFSKAILKSMKEIGGVPGIIAGFVETIGKLIENLRSTLEDNVMLKDYVSYQTLLKNTKQCLNNLTSHTITEGKTTKLIILVDELDRCLPDEQLTVLERLHHLFDVNNCAVIIAVNKNAVIKTFEKHYGGDGKEYLRKFFDHTFSIEAKADILLSNAIKEFINDLDNKYNKKPHTKEEIHIIVDAVVKECCRLMKANKCYDARTVKRMINRFEKIFDVSSFDSLVYIGYAYLLLFYKKFDMKMYSALRDGNYDGEYKFFDFGEISAYSFPYYDSSALSKSFPVFRNKVANEFLLTFNLFLFRKDDEKRQWLMSACTKAISINYDFDIAEQALQKICQSVDRFGD